MPRRPNNTTHTATPDPRDLPVLRAAPGPARALRLGISVPILPLTLLTPEHAARRPHMSLASRACRPGPAHIGRRPSTLPDTRAYRSAPERVVRRRACRPGPLRVAGRPGVSSGAACHGVPAHIARHPRTSSGAGHVTGRLRISLGVRAFPSEPVDGSSAPASKSPREQDPLGGVSRRGGPSLDTAHAANSPA